jgi:hypothetical protein
MSLKFCLLFLMIFSLTLPCRSQRYEVRAIEDESGYIAVQLRDTVSTGLPTTSTDFTDFQFEIRWPAAYGTEVDVQLICSDYFLVDGLGARQSTGSRYWRVFAADSIPFHPSQNWILRQWETIGTFKVVYPVGPDTGYFSLANQDWVIQGLNLGLEGVDYTPDIKDSVTNYIFPTTIWDWVWKGSGTPTGGFDEHSWTYGLNWVNECGDTYDASLKPTGGSRCIIKGGLTDYPTNFNNYSIGYCLNLKMLNGSYLEIPSGKLLNIWGTAEINTGANVVVKDGGSLNLQVPY